MPHQKPTMMLKIKGFIIDLALNHPKLILAFGGLITIFFLSAFPKLKTDTDPVHMLPKDNPAVLLHNKVKSDFKVSDLVALGIRTKNGESLFTVDGLTKLKKITDEILQIEGIFETVDLLSVSTVDDIVVNSKGELLVKKLMPEFPQTEEQAQGILVTINKNPMIAEKLASKKGDLVGIYMPLLDGKKEESYNLSIKIKAIAQKYLGENEDYYFAGLPVAESTFGNEMFIQMGVFAPMAGVVIFLLLLLFFKSWKVVIAPMVLSIMAVIWSMGALILSGNVIHIMSSMIPIFVMPIAVLNSIHILSVLADRLGHGENRKLAIKDTIMELFNPMLYTSLTTVVGFASLASTGIPPVIVFGITIAFGVAMAFLLSIIFIPAYTMLLSDASLKKFRIVPDKSSLINKVSKVFENASTHYAKTIVFFSIIIVGISAIGVSKIIINDNPVRWFKADHELRIADKYMNQGLAGTYMTNLVFSFDEKNQEENSAKGSTDEFEDEFNTVEKTDAVSIKNPEVLNYIDKISEYLKTLKTTNGEVLIGGTTGINDLVHKIGEVAFQNDKIPNSIEEISQYIFLFETGDLKKGRDLWKLIRPDGKSSQMWVHFKSGDNQEMTGVEKKLAQYIAENPVPVIEQNDGTKVPLKVEWSGLMHINSVWQDSMVKGMSNSLLGSFAIVFLMMIILFRSVLWALIAMLPLTITIAFIYGSIGYAGKFYDMPIAVLSSLTLGLSIDFSIHFIEHAMTHNKHYHDHIKTLDKLFNGTVQAIWRNILVISIGFTPLFFAALQPYVTVGMFFFLIMLVSGVTTLLLLPSLVHLFHKYLPAFKEAKK